MKNSLHGAVTMNREHFESIIISAMIATAGDESNSAVIDRAKRVAESAWLAMHAQQSGDVWTEPYTMGDANDQVRLCPHQQPVGECDDCDIESDHAYDCFREQRMFGR